MNHRRRLLPGGGQAEADRVDIERVDCDCDRFANRDDFVAAVMDRENARSFTDIAAEL